LPEVSMVLVSDGGRVVGNWHSLVSVLWHCWLGHFTRKKPVPNMTYNVFAGTLNLALSN